MYRCEHCNQSVSPGQTSHEVVLEVRPRRYAIRTPEPPKNRRAHTPTARPPAEGWEIARSARVCANCFGDLAADHDRHVEALASPAVAPALG